MKKKNQKKRKKKKKLWESTNPSQNNFTQQVFYTY